MQGGDRGIVELARKAAAAARTEPAARVAATLPVWDYRGVHQRKDRYYSVIWDAARARLLWLGSYETPEEAAYAYDAASRAIRGHRATPNFPAPALAPAPEVVSTDLALAPPTPAAPAHRFRHQQQPPALHPQASFDNWLLSGLAAAAAEPQQHQQGAGEPPPALFQQQQQQQQPPTVPVPRPPLNQFFHLALADHATPAAGAAANGTAAAAVVNPPSSPGAYILTPQNVQTAPITSTDNNPASTEQSSTDPVVVVHASPHFFPAAAPTEHRRELPVVSQDSVSDDLAVVEDNFAFFTDYGASSSAAPPPPRRLTDLDLLLHLHVSLPHVGLPGRGAGGGPGGAQ